MNDSCVLEEFLSLSLRQIICYSAEETLRILFMCLKETNNLFVCLFFAKSLLATCSSKAEGKLQQVPL